MLSVKHEGPVIFPMFIPSVRPFRNPVEKTIAIRTLVLHEEKAPDWITIKERGEELNYVRRLPDEIPLKIRGTNFRAWLSFIKSLSNFEGMC